MYKNKKGVFPKTSENIGFFQKNENVFLEISQFAYFCNTFLGHLDVVF